MSHDLTVQPTSRISTIAKALYLILQGSILPLAIFYIKDVSPDIISDTFLFSGLLLIFPTWLIIYIVMGLYRFPTNPPVKSVLTLAGFIVPLLFFFFFSDDSLPLQAYNIFLSGLVGILVFLGYTILSEIQIKGQSILSLVTRFGALILGIWFLFQTFIPHMTDIIANYQPFQATSILLGSTIYSIVSFFLLIQKTESATSNSEHPWGVPMSVVILMSLVISFLIGVFV